VAERHLLLWAPTARVALARAIQAAGAPRVVTTELHDATHPVLGVLIA